jgi:hypothetical protein
MPAIEILESPEPGGGTLIGNVTFEPGIDWERKLLEMAVQSYYWSRTHLEHSHRHGWKPFGTLGRIDANRQWRIEKLPAAPQYAAVLVPDFYVTGPDPDDPALVHEEPAAGTLPLVNGVDAVDISQDADTVEILTVPSGPFNGLILGVGIAMWAPERLHRRRWAREEERYRVAAWAVDGDRATCLGVRPCELSGYWSFGRLDAPAKNAASYTVAFVSATYNPAPGPCSAQDVPQVGGGRTAEVIHVKHRARSSARAAGQAPTQ